MKAKKFQRNPKARRRAGRSDKTGTIQISVYLRGDRGAYIKGNLFRAFSVIDAKVSDVAAAIETSLFENKPTNGRTEARKAATA